MTYPFNIYTPDYLTPLHESMSILDSTKLGDFRRCPRYGFFRHVQGWNSAEPNVDLIFGQAWHTAMEFIFQHGLDDFDNYKIAHILGMEEILKHFTVEQDAENYPKSTKGLYNGLLSFFDQRGEWADYTFIDSEISGDLILEEGKALRFKIDLILFDHRLNGLSPADHKTSKSSSYIYRELFQNSFQMKCYLYAAKSYFGGNEVKGLFINRSEFLKNSVTHRKLIYMPSDETLQLWNVTALIEFNRILHEIQQYATYDHPDNSIMLSFPQCDSGCSKYNRLCEYFNICTLLPNPLKLKETPEGFIQRFWSPGEED